MRQKGEKGSGGKITTNNLDLLCRRPKKETGPTKGRRGKGLVFVVQVQGWETERLNRARNTEKVRWPEMRRSTGLGQGGGKTGLDAL